MKLVVAADAAAVVDVAAAAKNGRWKMRIRKMLMLMGRR